MSKWESLPILFKQLVTCFEGTSPDLCFRLLRQKRYNKCWSGEADYFPVSEYPMFNFGAIAVPYLYNRPGTPQHPPFYHKVAIDGMLASQRKTSRQLSPTSFLLDIDTTGSCYILYRSHSWLLQQVDASSFDAD